MKSTDIIRLTMLTSLRRQKRGMMWNEILQGIVLLFLIPSYYPASIHQDFINSNHHFYVAPLHEQRNNHLISCVNVFTVIFCPDWPLFLYYRTLLPRLLSFPRSEAFVCSHVLAECEAEWLLYYHLPASVNCWYKGKLNRIQKVCSECPTFTLQLHTAASNGAKKGVGGGGERKIQQLLCTFSLSWFLIRMIRAG